MRLIAASLSLLVGLVAAVSAPGQSASFLGKSADEWGKELEDRKASATRRRSAAFALGRLGENGYRYVGPLARAVREDGDPGVRETSAAAVAEIVLASTGRDLAHLWDHAGPGLRKALEADPDPLVKR